MFRRLIIISFFCVAMVVPLSVFGVTSEVMVEGILSINEDGYILFPDGTSQSTATKTGPAGTNGISVIGSSESPGANCTYGGVKYTSASGDNYVCNGAPGAAGANGVSVIGASESPGANCTYGGVKYTSASGDNYVCNGAPGAKGDKGDTGSGNAAAWSGTGSYATGDLVTSNGQLYVAVASGGSVAQPGTSLGDSYWSGVVTGSGNTARGIPLTILPHTFDTSGAFYLSPVSTTSSSTIGPYNTALVPSDCRPSMTIYSLGSSGGTFTLSYVTPTSGGITWSKGSDIVSCAVGSSSGGVLQVCSGTAASKISAGSILTIVAPKQTLGGTSGVFVAFSCM
ncbi:MAG TPA: hypothetical protein VMB78_03995 [Dissulfurispiraceae bacterium]|nr:hypothetical protein [Dissulfurispiraceae bacterium]